MEHVNNTASHTTKMIRWIARIWGAVLIGITLIILAGYGMNWVRTGTPDPHAAADYPPSENLIPLTLVLSVLGVGIAWRWEGLGGAINVAFYLANLAVHHWILSPRPYPYVLAIIITPPGILFLACWWRSRKSRIIHNGD